MTTEELINRIDMVDRPMLANTRASNSTSDGTDYMKEIFLLEMPEGGDIEDIRAVGFSGWQGTLKNEPKQPVRFYVQVIGFEDINSPARNWQIKTDKIVVPEAELAKALAQKLRLLV